MAGSSTCVSPKQAARALGVSESSLKRWCDQGLLEVSRTAGGHRQLPVSEVVRFAREHAHTLQSPEILGLPAVSPHSRLALHRAIPLLTDALLSGEELLARQIVSDLYLARHRLTVILDEVIAAALHEIGQRWECQEADVYQERWACEITRRILFDLRRLQLPPDRRMVAIGGTVENDLYSIPTLMAELVVRENGWQASSLGSGIPVSSLVQAVNELRPKLFWLSASFIQDPAEFLDGFAKISQACAASDVALVVGGRALTQDLREKMSYSTFCDTMQHLEAFARTIHRSRKGGVEKIRDAAPRTCS
ncbi:MAG: helix-turn-helix domain-containing protein [Planctomycetaceae bacterium]